ncbi:hemerythrin domain-containing protein [Bacillaceae bacterium S4-13-58]
MEASNLVLCKALQQLKNEHVELRTDMDRFYDLAEEIEYESGPIVVQLFATLYDQVLAFTERLKKHSHKEDNGLFPLMKLHLEDNDRTIEEMEEEHEKAEGHLNSFLTEAMEGGLDLKEDDIQTMTVYVQQAYATLTQHFAKEEKVLFPLAENILSSQEKEELMTLWGQEQ